MSGPGSIVTLMTRVLGPLFSAESWATWRVILKATFVLPLTDAERERFRALSRRERPPVEPPREAWIIAGRRSGKSQTAALIAVHATCCRTYTLSPGEVGVFMVIAADRRQARVVKRYIAGLLRSVPELETLIARETQEAIWLTNGLVIEIHTASFRTLRGYTVIGAVCDEVAFWSSEDSANPDTEVLTALRAAMATVRQALLWCITSPCARRGEAWRIYTKHFGREDVPVLVVQAATHELNPTVPEDIIASAYEEDEAAAVAEYGAQFRRDVETFISRDALEAVRMQGRFELPPLANVRYVAFCDPAGGSGQDSFTLAISHVEAGQLVLDAVREQKPPFSPEATVEEFARLLRAYLVSEVQGDRFAGVWPAEQFRKAGITFRPADAPKSDLYQNTLPLINSGRAELLDHPRLIAQFAGLERRTARSGRDSIDHSPHGHDDVANAVAGALLRAHGEQTSTFRIVKLVGF